MPQKKSDPQKAVGEKKKLCDVFCLLSNSISNETTQFIQWLSAVISNLHQYKSVVRVCLTVEWLVNTIYL